MIGVQGNRITHIANGQIPTDAKLDIAVRLAATQE